MEDIYQEYSKAVYNYLLSLTKNKHIAEELVQETFYSAVKNINNFKNESSVKTWLYKIAKNKWIDYYKKNKKSKEISINEDSKELLKCLKKYWKKVHHTFMNGLEKEELKLPSLFEIMRL